MTQTTSVSPAASQWPVRRLLGVPIHALTMEQVLDVVDDVIAHRRRLLIGVVNVAKVVHMHDDALLREAVLTADMVLADGMPLVWASRMLRCPLPERVAGIDLMHRMLERGSERKYRVYCLGAKQDVLETTIERMRAQYPGAVMAGWRNGYFDASQEAAIAAEIREARPDMLFVAMSPPKKEQFLARWSEEMQVPVCHGVGGAFDVMAGKVKRAPMAWQNLGLEWLYRVIQEPRRMWKRYLVTNTRFVVMILGELFGSRRAGAVQD